MKRMQRFPQYYERGLLTVMQQVLALGGEDFTAKREEQHLCRLVDTQYRFFRFLKEGVKKFPEKRHLFVKLIRDKHFVGVVVGINFLKEQEIFEKRHLLAAIQNYIPNAKAVEGSFFSNRPGAGSLCILYLEIEKEEKSLFTSAEMQWLKNELSIDLKDRVEHWMHPLFMQRNEEEIVRNVVTLSHQFKFPRDIPQVTLSFDEQSDNSLFFTIVLVRLVKPKSISIQDSFRYEKSFLKYIPDRCKDLGYLRFKYKKEATIFRVEIAKQHFLRRDFSVDVNKARQAVFDELTRILGDLRDFNGGMISKQNDLLRSLRTLLGEKVKYNEMLMENFFYSLMPVIMRTVMDPHALETLFLMHLEALERGYFPGEQYWMKVKNDTEFVYVIIKVRGQQIKEEWNGICSQLGVLELDLAKTLVNMDDVTYLGFIYRCDGAAKQREFYQSLQNMMQTWEHQKTKFRIQRSQLRKAFKLF